MGACTTINNIFAYHTPAVFPVVNLESVAAKIEINRFCIFSISLSLSLTQSLALFGLFSFQKSFFPFWRTHFSSLAPFSHRATSFGHKKNPPLPLKRVSISIPMSRRTDDLSSKEVVKYERMIAVCCDVVTKGYGQSPVLL